MKTHRFRMAAVISGLMLLATGTGLSQGRPPRPPGGPDGGFVAAEMRFGRTVKGAPYSAQVITESTQTLADGSKISRQTTGAVYRDSEGRTRNEETFNGVGPFAANGAPKQMVFVNDPVAGANYRLDPTSRSATKFTIPARKTPPASAGSGGQNLRSEDPSHRMDSSNRTVEQLGTQTIEGVEAQGTRTTFTIPAGSIGNDKAIQVVSERWYSPALQVVVMSKHSDPRQGDHVYRLTNISRTEPAAALFTVPTDYTVRDAPIGRPGPGGRGRTFTPPSRPNTSNNND